MKLKKGIVLGNVDGNSFAIATGKMASKLNGIINNNKTAATIFELLQTEQTEDSLVDAMYEKYDAPKEVIRADVKEILEKMQALGILE
ncbi:MAG: PqqD family protein [Eubacterium sp.]|nr:PqqD family protein [Eubacterium sp.]